MCESILHISSSCTASLGLRHGRNFVVKCGGDTLWGGRNFVVKCGGHTVKPI